MGIINAHEEKGMDAVLTVIIPAYNEADSLPVVLPPLIDYCFSRNWKIILINDGSTDKTPEILKEFEPQPNFKVIHHKVNRGYGGALKSGILAADTEFMVTIDADGQHVVNDIDLMLAAMRAQDADLVVGRRRGGGKVHLYRETGKKIIRTIASILMTLPIYDINSGFKLYRSELAKLYLAVCPDGMSFSDIITLTFVNQRHKVIETDIHIKERVAGSSSISTRTAFETVQEIINVVMLFHPLKIFLPLSLVIILIGILWGIPFAVLGHGISVGSMLAIVTGLLLLFLGLIAEQISNLQRNIIELKREFQIQKVIQNTDHQ